MTEPSSDAQALLREHRVLLGHYGQVQRRCDALFAAQRERIEQLEAAVMRLRGALIARDTALACAHEDRALRARTAAVSLDVHRKAVLCVGQDAPDTNATQRVVERAGGHFLHHDGADADNGAALEASLRAADMVICQTGCISHDAYWRVQDHCRRTGKQCVLVNQPQPLRFVPRPGREVVASEAGS